MYEALSRTIRKIRLALVSEAQGLGSLLASIVFPVEIFTSPPYSITQLEYFACRIHCEFDKPGGRLEQVSCAYAIRR